MSIKITGYSFMLSAENHQQNEIRKTYLNVQYEVDGKRQFAKIPMHKDEYGEIRHDIENSRVMDNLKQL